jgi:pimeloyl-ACP methyl ester carboxylesterase
LGSERVWPNVNLLFKHPEILRYSKDTQLKPKGILNEMVVVPNLISFDQYNLLGDYLVEELGYERGNNFIEFAYDWRQDVRQSARDLARFIDGWDVNSPITIIAHSLGTLVSRYYVELLGGKKKIGRLMLIGGPHQGVPKIAANLLTGVDLLPFGLMGKKLTEIIETFPSCYQILPLYPCATDQNGNPIHFLEDESWVKAAYRPLHRAAREFRRELGTKSSVPTLSIFGYGLKTAMQMRIQRNSNDVFQKVLIDVQPSGDSSVPENSAVLPRTEIHPVQQYHGTLFNDNDVKMRLKLELLQDRG